MNAAAASRDPFMPQPAQRTGPALGLALFAHALLIAALAFGVNWRDSEPTSLAAELWSAVPQAAAPRAVEVPTPPPPPPRPEVRKPEPVVKPEPAPKPQAALPDPQIAIEKAKREEAKREQAEEEARQQKLEKAQRAKEELAQKKAAADKLAKERAETDKADKLAKEKADKADATKQAAIRDANLKRMQGLAGATGGPSDTGTALRSSAPSANYGGRITAYIKPKIVLTEPVDGNPRAVVEIRLAPDGTIIAKRLVKSSGSKAWDDAVLRAIERAEVLPRDVDGRAPPLLEVGFKPLD
ncbi:MAG: cell envelope integrity protein TolA [Burkholderiales bacterium]